MGTDRDLPSRAIAFETPQACEEFLGGVESFACLYFAKLLGQFRFESLAELNKFLAFWGKIMSPGVRERFDRPDIDGVATQHICMLFNAYHNNRHFTLKYAKKAHAEYPGETRRDDVRHPAAGGRVMQHHDRRIDTAQLNDLTRRFGAEALALPIMGSKHLRAILDREGVQLHPRALGELRHLLQLERVKAVIAAARPPR